MFPKTTKKVFFKKIVPFIVSQVYIGSLISFIRLSVNLIINLLQFLSILINCQRKFSMKYLHENFLSSVLSGKMFLDLICVSFFFFLILRLKYLKFSEPQGGKHNAGKNEIYSIDFIIYHFTMPEEHCYLKAA